MPAEEKSFFLDLKRLIDENFENPSKLSDTQYWILNQMMIKKIESFIASKYESVWIYSPNPTRDKIKALKELVQENQLQNIVIDQVKA